MSLNRTTYDTCAYKQYLGQSVSPLEYVLNPIKYNHCKQCRMELGIVGGTAVSHVNGNMVDMENELRGQTRQLSECPDLKHQPKVIHPKELMHLPPCQMINYGDVPAPPPLRKFKCRN